MSDSSPALTASPPPAATGPRRRRLLGPSLAIAGVGAAIAAAFAAGVGHLPWGPPLFMMTLGGFALGLTAVALYRVIDPFVRREDALPQPPRAPARVRELEREKQMVLKAIKEIELDYQMRKITEEDRRTLTQRYRERALRILGELDAGDDFRALIELELKHRLAAQLEAKSAAAGTRVCAACGKSNDADARFCKSCGATLGAEAAP